MWKIPSKFDAWRRIGVAALIALAMTGCRSADSGDPVAPVAEVPLAASCGDQGLLKGAIYGAIETHIDWGQDDLECTGMPRPEGRGARLRLAGITPGDGHRLAIILAIPELDRDMRRAEFSANVTLIEEGNGRFFSTPDLGNCLADITAAEAVDETGDRFAVAGALYCVAPLPEINGASSVSIPELQFSGLLDWSAS